MADQVGDFRRLVEASPCSQGGAGSVDAEELGGGAAEDGDALVVAQARDRATVSENSSPTT